MEAKPSAVKDSRFEVRGKKSRGYGFGLHSCANDLNEMGAEIIAESKGIGKGARFTIYFPIQTSS